MSNDLKCPHCEKEHDYDETDVGQDEVIHAECPHCEKVFIATAYWDLHFTNIEKAPCLNGGEHDLKESIGIPKELPRQYRCQSCDLHGPIERFKF